MEGLGFLLPTLTFVTLGAVIVFALWSKRKTREELKGEKPHTPSSLARETPDPKFQPDRDVTDPHHVRG